MIILIIQAVVEFDLNSSQRKNKKFVVQTHKKINKMWPLRFCNTLSWMNIVCPVNTKVYLKFKKKTNNNQHFRCLIFLNGLYGI